MSKITNTENGLAISGFDTVSYHQGEPQMGKPEFTTEHNGATYQFASESNLKAFLAAPDQYLPAYGGYCATAMSEGKLFEVDPQNFRIQDGRLFLFYKGEHGDTLPEWVEDETNRLNSADLHWENETFVNHE